MFKTLLIFHLLACLPAGDLMAEVFRDSGSNFEIDFPAGWKVEKSKDPAVVLRLARGQVFFEFSKLDSELSDYYLKARVKEQVDSLRAKGNTISGDVRSVPIRGVSTAYFLSYESMGSFSYIAFLTYAEKSYAVSAHGVDEVFFRVALSRFRGPGEVIKAAAPPPRPGKTASKVPAVRDQDDDAPETPAYGGASTGTASPVSSGPVVDPETVFAVEEDSAPAAAAPPAAPGAMESASALFSRVSRSAASKQPPYLKRVPLPAWLAGALLAVWIIGAVLARSSAAKYANPKLSPPPAEVPPDFFFPFIISRFASFREAEYRVLTRQKQALSAYYNYEHDVWLAAGFYGLVLFHLAWAFAGLAPGANPLTLFMTGLPGGRAFASLPEAVFVLPLLVGLYKKAMHKGVLDIYDKQANKVLEVRPELAYGLIRDGNGKEVARLYAREGGSGRFWEFVDTDNQVVLTVRDDAPGISLACKFFGVQGGALRRRYGIFAQERRAGFVFLDPSSADRFQIHLEFDYARLAHPAHIMAAVIYIISREREHPYPAIF